MLKEYILLLVIVLGVSSCTAWLDPDVPDFHFYYCLNGEQFSCKKYHSRSIITSIMKEENEVFLQRTNHSGKAFFKMFIIEPFELYFEYVGDEECFIEGEKYVLTKNNLEYPDTLDDGWFSLNTSTKSGVAFTVYFDMIFSPRTSNGDEIYSLSGNVEVSKRYMDRKNNYSELIKKI